MPPQLPLALSYKASPLLWELPNEIVQQIFAVFATTLSTRKLALFPWFLGHICSSWRYIFLSMTTEFWSSISIIFGLERPERTVDVVLFFLERDLETPLSFNVLLLHRYSKYYRHAAHQIRQIMEALVDKSMRWRKASFSTRARDLLPLTLAKDRLPILQELHLLLDVDEDVPCELHDVFQNTPSLDVVRIRELADWKFNLLNLKAIDVYRLGDGAFNFITTLPQMTKLERLELDYPLDDAIPSSAIVLPNLTTLSCGPIWLHLLQAPALEVLLIDYDLSDSPDIVLSFLCRSTCDSKILRLGISSAQASTAIEIIRHTPRITHLDLWNIAKPGNVFKQLTVPANPAHELLARHLLSLYFCDLDDTSDDDIGLLSDLISSRTVGSATDSCGYKRLEKLELAGDMYRVSSVAKSNVIALCEERGVQYVEY